MKEDESARQASGTWGIAKIDRPHNLYRCETFKNLLYFSSRDIIGVSLDFRSKFDFRTQSN